MAFHPVDKGRGGRQPYRQTKEQIAQKSARMKRIHAEKKAKREAMRYIDDMYKI